MTRRPVKRAPPRVRVNWGAVLHEVAHLYETAESGGATPDVLLATIRERIGPRSDVLRMIGQALIAHADALKAQGK